MKEDSRTVLGAAPMHRLQILIVALCIALNALDGFDVLAISFAAGLPPASPTFAGRPVEPVRGTSWAAHLRGESKEVHRPDEATGWELFGHRAIRQGDWKIVALADGEWQLFNLAEDPGETRDLAAAQPARLKRLIAAWNDYARQTGVILPDKSYKP